MLSAIIQAGLAIIFALSLPTFAFAQANADKQLPIIHVPFVGCKNYIGNGGGVSAEPKEKDKVVQIDAAAAKNLAYYGSEIIGVLAPRGWHCIGYSGSSGAYLFVTPQPIHRGNHFDGNGPAVIVGLADASTSGRFAVARVIARFFPVYKRFVEKVIKEGVEPASDFPFGPSPKDKVTYLSDSTVEIQTPPGSEGFGTQGGFTQNTYPINGVAILAKPDEETDGFLNENAGWEGTEALLLHVRLQPDKYGLTSQIMRQFEAQK